MDKNMFFTVTMASGPFNEMKQKKTSKSKINDKQHWQNVISDISSIDYKLIIFRPLFSDL